MAITYNSLGSQVTITVAGTTISAGFTSAVAVVGGYDSANADASVTPGESMVVSGPTEARSLFGADCELTYQIEQLQTPELIYAVPVAETEETESFSSTGNGTLASIPQDPTVHPDSSITVTNTTNSTDVTVEEVYIDGAPTAPTDDNTVVIDMVTGQWAADSSASYEFVYTTGDYEAAIDAAVGEPVRYVMVCTEQDSVVQYLDNELGIEADNGSYKRGIVGAKPSIDAGDIDNYTPAVESFRMIEVAPARGTDTNGNSVRTLGAVTNLLAVQPIDSGGSVTYDEVTGLDSLDTTYRPNEAKQFEQVLALTRDMKVAEGVTTSADKPLRDIYKAEIVDTIVESYFNVLENFSGGPNTDNSTGKLRGSLRRVSNSFASSRPPALATSEGTRPYDIQVSLGQTDEQMGVVAGIEPASIAKEINLDLNVGEVNTVEIDA